MADRDVTVRLQFDSEAFAARLSRVAEAARVMNAEWQIRQATWEPHDWSALDG